MNPPHDYLTDSELRGVGESGGVVAISLDERRIARGHAATLHDLIRQITYVAKTAGIAHVAIGSGYEGIHPPDGAHVGRLVGVRLVAKHRSRRASRPPSQP